MKPGQPVESRVVWRVRALRLEGRTQDAIAVEVGLAQGTVSKILRAAGLGGQLKKMGLATRRISCSPELA